LKDRIAIVDAVNYAKSYSRSHGAIIRLFDESGDVIETHQLDTLSESKRGSAHTRLPDFSLETQAPLRELQKPSSRNGAA
jgi:hypothetical protein